MKMKRANPSNMQVIAESARPEINEYLLRNHKIKIKKAYKPAGSIVSGINKLLNYDIVIDPDSIDVIHEFRNYAWISDKSGDNKDTPIDSFNHAIDALRYGIQGIRTSSNTYSQIL